MRVYTTLSGAEGQFHIWAPGLTSDPLHFSKKKKKKEGKQKKVKKAVVSVELSVRLFGYKKHSDDFKKNRIPCSFDFKMLSPSLKKIYMIYHN